MVIFIFQAFNLQRLLSLYILIKGGIYGLHWGARYGGYHNLGLFGKRDATEGNMEFSDSINEPAKIDYLMGQIADLKISLKKEYEQTIMRRKQLLNRLEEIEDFVSEHSEA